jgi:asparagine synthase (glutamine-hydrolysing)
MSAFVGIAALSGRAIDREAGERAASALARLRGGWTRVSHGESALLLERIGQDDRAAQAQSRSVSSRPTLFAALARLDNREELGDMLGLAHTERSQTPDAALLRHMFDKWGDAGVARCLGTFAFAHWDGVARRLTLGRDCLGNCPLFYHCGPEFIWFATSLGVLLALPGVPRAIDELALAQFIAINNGNERQTFYRGIDRVQSRTLVTVDSQGPHRRTYWRPDLDAPPPYRRDQDYLERARELLDIAVASATRDTSRVAIAVSGGLDSSAIAATAARQRLVDGITCFSLVPPAGTQINVGRHRYLDERDKLEELRRMYPRLDVRFVCPDSIHPTACDDTRHFARQHLPTLHPTDLGVSSYLSDAVAAAGHRTLLSGNYGNFGLTWWGTFSLLELFRARRWRDFVREWRAVARENDQSLVRALAANLVVPSASQRMRPLIYRLRGRDPDSVARHSALNPAFIAATGLARQWQKEGFDPWFGPRDSNPRRLRAYLLFDHNQYTRDVRGAAEEVYGYDVRNPQGDRRLLEFALSVPETMYQRDGIQRSFARRVLADRLPPAIINERRRGAHAPTWFRVLDARRNDIAADVERLQASPLASRLLDLPRLKRLMDQWPKDANEAERRKNEYCNALARGVHVGRFIRWVEGGNA